jgi:hypothetical protein
VKLMLKELGFNTMEPMRLYCDNKATINIARNPIQHYRTKHVEIDRNFIKEKLDDGVICTLFVKTGDQPANVLARGVSSSLSTNFKQVGHEKYIFINLRGSIGILNLVWFEQICQVSHL